MAKEKGEAAMAEKGKGAVAAAEKGKGVRPTAAEKRNESMLPAEATASGNTIKLKSSDERIFEVPTKAAKLFKTIGDVIDKGDADDVIPLPNVHSSTLAKVIEYCVKHPRMSAGDNSVSEPDACRWDREFVGKLDVNALYDVMLAAHYLDYDWLLDLLCKAVADMMAGKTTEQIRAIFGIENDFTPEEEAAIRGDYAWAFMD